MEGKQAKDKRPIFSYQDLWAKRLNKADKSAQ